MPVDDEGLDSIPNKSSIESIIQQGLTTASDGDEHRRVWLETLDSAASYASDLPSYGAVSVSVAVAFGNGPLIGLAAQMPAGACSSSSQEIWPVPVGTADTTGRGGFCPQPAVRKAHSGGSLRHQAERESARHRVHPQDY